MSVSCRIIVTLILCMGWAGSVHPAGGQPTANPSEKDTGLQLKLIAKNDKYTIDLDGKSLADYRKRIDAIIPDGHANPAGPKVDLALEITNPTDRAVTIMVDGDDTSLTLELKGPGAVSKQITKLMTADIKVSKAIEILPGKSYSQQIKSLVYVRPRPKNEWYWTMPGEYELSATWKLGDAKDESKGPTLVAAPIKLHVTLGKSSAKTPAPTLIEPVTPKKDPKTGFIVGGKNDTALIRKLTEINGVPIANLEKVMRPGVDSRAGFLGKEEKLLDVLVADNQFVVEKLGLTHQILAKHLKALGQIGDLYFQAEAKLLPEADLAKQLQALEATPGKAPNEFTYHGRRFKVVVTLYRGIQHSPFEDGTKTNKDAKIDNLDTGKKLWFSQLVPMMIERYGFYEGTGTSYRVDPRQIVEVLDFLQKSNARDKP